MPVIADLPRRLGIVIPSRDRNGTLLRVQVIHKVRKKVTQWFADAFEGSTGDRMQMRPRLRGRWGKGTGITQETVEEIWAYCSAAESRKYRPSLISLAEWVCDVADQHVVAVLIDGGMKLVNRRSN
jgi:hypothetical protein